MDEKELLQRALGEIKSLRKQNELMTARLDMFDAVMSALCPTWQACIQS